MKEELHVEFSGLLWYRNCKHWHTGKYKHFDESYKN